MASGATQERFSTRIGFLLAAIGAAVGLGNLWKFPYMLGSNGGAAFVLVYLVAIVVIATPIMIAEMLIGRRGRRSAPASMKLLAEEVGSSEKWKLVGWLGIFTLVLVLSFFSVIAGWSIAYVFKTLSGTFSNLTPAQVGTEFESFLGDPINLTIWHAVFMAVTIFIVARGIKGGIEKAIMFMMPALFVMLVGLVIYGMVAGEFMQAVAYLFRPDFSKINPQVALSAFGQAFFSVNVGVGTILTYAAYLPKSADIVRSSVVIAIGDTCVALLAGLMIFPIVFAYDLDPGQGPGLIFVTLSAAFGAMPGGTVIGAVFFTLVFLAALSSSISMLEVSVSRFSEKAGWSRTRAAIVVGIIIFFVGFITLGSFNFMSDVRPLGATGIPLFANMTPFGVVDFSVTNLLMPLGAMFYAIFVGWFVTSEMARETLNLEDGPLFSAWRFIMRYVAPIGIIAIVASSIYDAVLAA